MSVQPDSIHTDNQFTQSPKLLIATALISAATTIGAAFLGVVPQLRNKDVSEISDLQRQIEILKHQASILTSTVGNSSPPAAKKLLIGGTVMDARMNRPLDQAEVYLIPMNKNPKLMSKTNDSGEFTFPDMPDQQYWIVVRDTVKGNASAGLMDDDQTEARLAGMLVKYRVQK